MTTEPKRLPLLFIMACTIFSAGVICLGLTFTLQLNTHTFRGLLYISMALVVFGIGEIINHPKQRVITGEDRGDSSQVILRRRRNVCSLGNLCDIGALLLFFIGLATLLFPR